MLSSDSSLLDFIAAVSGESHLKVEEDLGDGFVRLRTAEAERRQAKHDIRSVEDIVVEMLRNARDAGATSIFVAASREDDIRTLVFLDNGCGIPISMQKRIFEPRVTSKLESMTMDRWGVHGRGMALYSIKENARQAYVVDSDEDKGSSIAVVVDLASLPEKSDQSSYPIILKEEDGSQRIARSPHNIIRQVLEFALEHRNIDVYLGSPTEITSTLCYLGGRILDEQELLFCDSLDDLPVYLRPAACGDANELARVCESIGLQISERSAHRILAGDIKPLRPPINRLIPQATPRVDDSVDILRDRRGLKISKDDLDAFARTMERAFQKLGDAYYLSLKDIPKVTVTKDAIRVKFEIEKES